MKRIIQILVCLIFMGMTFLIYQNYSNKELTNIIGNNYYIVDIQEKEDNVLTVLNLVSEKKDALIGKYNYEFNEDMTGNLSIYLSDYNKTFFDALFLKKISQKELGKGNYYTTNRNDTNDNVIGYINILSSDVEFSVKSLNDLDIRNANNTVFIDAKDDNALFDILNELRNNGINATYTPEDYYIKSNTFDLYKDIKSIVICIALFLLLAIVYTIFRDYKKFAIYEMLGYSKKQIIFQEFIRYFKMILSIFLLFMLIVLSISFAKYASFNRDLIIYYLQQYLLLGLLFLIVIYISLQLIYLVDIKSMIKNNYPFKLIFNFSIFSKILVSIILFITAINSYITFQSMQQEKDNAKEWEYVKNLYYTELHNFEPDASKSYFPIGSKFQNLFEKLNNENAILFRYELIDKIGGIELDKTVNNEYMNYLISINNNYLSEHAIYDSENERIKNLELDNNLMILIPEKYRSTDFENALSFNARQLRYYDENLYRKSNNLPEIEVTDYNVEFIYIKDNQKFFSYDESVNRQNFNYIFDPIIYICNDQNRSTDFYLSAFSNGNIYFNNSLKDILLNDVDTRDYIVGITNAYTRISTVIMNLENSFNLATINFIGIIFVYLLILMITSLYYYKINSQKFAIMKLHGYTVWSMAVKYLLLDIVLSCILAMLLLYLNGLFTIPFIIIFIIAIILEGLILYGTLYQNNKINI